MFNLTFFSFGVKISKNVILTKMAISATSLALCMCVQNCQRFMHSVKPCFYQNSSCTVLVLTSGFCSWKQCASVINQLNCFMTLTASLACDIGKEQALLVPSTVKKLPLSNYISGNGSSARAVFHWITLSWVTVLHRESKKGCHHNHCYNFVNSWSICKILSLLQRTLNFQQNHIRLLTYGRGKNI